VWESDGVPQTKIEEPLVFENVTPSQRSYK
jgi:hypothetical protein